MTGLDSQGIVADRAQLAQSIRVNPDFTKRIVDLLTRLYGEPRRLRDGGKWTMQRPRPTGVVVFRLGGRVRQELISVMPDKRVNPEFLCALTLPQLDLFVQTSIDADGHRRRPRGGIGQWTGLSQADEGRTRAFEMACVLSGRAISTRSWREKKWITTVRVPNHVMPIHQRKRPQVVPYSGIVWCPTTALGTWFARRHGTVYFTGNSDFEGPLAMPINQLVADLRALGLEDLAQQAINGEFDGTKEESEAWAKSPDGQAAFAELVGGARPGNRKQRRARERRERRQR